MSAKKTIATSSGSLVFVLVGLLGVVAAIVYWQTLSSFLIRVSEDYLLFPILSQGQKENLQRVSPSSLSDLPVRTSPMAVPRDFKGPTGQPHIIGPSGPPPQY